MKKSLFAIFLTVSQFAVAQISAPSEADFEIDFNDLKERSGQGLYTQNNSQSLGTILNKHWKLTNVDEDLSYLEFKWFGNSKKIENQDLHDLIEDDFLKFSINDTIVFGSNDTKIIEGLPESFELVVKKDGVDPKSFKYQFLDGASKVQQVSYLSINPYYDALRLRYEPFSTSKSILKSYGPLDSLAINPFFDQALKDSIDVLVKERKRKELFQQVYDSLKADSANLNLSFVNDTFNVYAGSYPVDAKQLLDSLYSLNKATIIKDSLTKASDTIASFCYKEHLKLYEFLKSESDLFQEYLLRAYVDSLRNNTALRDALLSLYFKAEFDQLIDSVKQRVKGKEPVDQAFINKQLSKFYENSEQFRNELDSLKDPKDKYDEYLDMFKDHVDILMSTFREYNKDHLNFLANGFKAPSVNRGKIQADLDRLKRKLKGNDFSNPRESESKIDSLLDNLFKTKYWKHLINPFDKDKAHLDKICSTKLLEGYLKYSFDRKKRELLQKLLDTTFREKIIPFMNAFKQQQEEVKLLAGGSSRASAQNGVVGNLVTSVGGLPVSTLADGLTQFMIERAKEELNIAFFQRMKKFFDRTPEIRVLFPKSSDALENLLSYQYTMMLPALREAFYQDLNNVFFRTDDVFKLPKYRDLIQEFPEIILCLKTMQTMAELDNESHPADVINDIVAIPEWHDKVYTKNFSAKLNNFKVSLQFANLISESLRIQLTEDKVVLKIDDLNDKTYLQIWKEEKKEGAIIKVDSINQPQGDTIRTYDNGRVWLTHQHLNYLIQDTSAFNIYLGLLYEKSRAAQLIVAKRIQLTSDLTLSKDKTILRGSILKEGSTINGASALSKDKTYKTQIELKPGSKIITGSILYQPTAFHKEFAERKSELHLLRDYLNEFIDLTEEVDDMFKGLKTKHESESDSVSKEEMRKYLNIAIDVVEYCADISYLFQDDVDFTNYLKIARNGNDLYYNLATKKYVPAVNNLATMLETISDEVKKNPSQGSGTTEAKQKIAEIKSNRNADIGKAFFGSRIYFSSRKQSINQSYRKEIRQVKQTSRSKFENFAGKTSQILRYGLFMAHIVESDSVEEVKAAIEAAALPVGSFTIKRHAEWNISINSYLGASYGWERVKNVGTTNKTSDVLGVHAPVGIALSHRLWSTNKGGTWGSLSLFASLLDLGAVAQFRLENPATDIIETDSLQTTSFDELPDLKLKNLFAPGGYVVWGISNSPLALGFGAQYGPALRDITVTTEDETGMQIAEAVISESSAWRYGFFLSVDLPLLNLYTRRGKR